MSRQALKRALLQWGLQVRRVPPTLRPNPRTLPDWTCYEPEFKPYLLPGPFRSLFDQVSGYTLLGLDRCHVLYTLANQALALPGEWWECGVFRGGTAMLFASLLRGAAGEQRVLRLFDTFAGMPEVDPARDLHKAGDFADTSLEEVRSRVGSDDWIHLQPGWIPDTFRGLESNRIAFAHVDVDIYRSVLDCCEHIVPRLVPGGIIVFDDYGFPTCPGARAAIDEFFASRPEWPLVLGTGQAIVVRVP